jgi:hypothetical protein
MSSSGSGRSRDGKRIRSKPQKKPLPAPQPPAELQETPGRTEPKGGGGVKERVPARRTARSSATSLLALDSFRAVEFVATTASAKIVVVATAVRQQLEQDTRWPPNDISKTMDKDYLYSRDTLRNFLNAVADRLGAAGYTFTFSLAFVTQALPKTVAALTGAIAEATL